MGLNHSCNLDSFKSSQCNPWIYYENIFGRFPDPLCNNLVSMTIEDAKQKFKAEYSHDENVLGVGIGDVSGYEVLIILVRENKHYPLVYEGYDLIPSVTGEIKPK